MEDSKNRLNRRKAIKKIISQQAVSDQLELLDLIEKDYGIKTSQAVISRDLHALGVTKQKVNNKLIYELQEKNPIKEMLRLAIVDVQHNEYLIVVHTIPGLAAFVGDYIDETENKNILGTIAGENTIFVTPKRIKEIKKTYKELCSLLYVKKQENNE